jgi:hydroxymethylbilane synthase
MARLAATGGHAAELAIIKTTGDRQQDADGGAVPGVGIFVREIEAALLEGRIDLAVHSYKDLPTAQPAGLRIGAVPPREDPRDALVTRDGAGLETLPAGARVGTGSPRRAAQILAARPDLQIVPMRGNVETRVRRMLEGACDALVLAAAGLARLGCAPGSAPEGARAVLLDEAVCLPAVAQGALALEIRAGDAATHAAIAPLHDAAAGAETAAERAFLEHLGGGCRAPIAALGRSRTQRLRLTGLVCRPDGSAIIRVEATSDGGDPAALGRRLAEEALARGAQAIVAESG